MSPEAGPLRHARAIPMRRQVGWLALLLLLLVLLLLAVAMERSSGKAAASLGRHLQDYHGALYSIQHVPLTQAHQHSKYTLR